MAVTSFSAPRRRARGRTAPASDDATPRIRPLAKSDAADVIRIDAHYTGFEKPRYWRRLLDSVLRPSGDATRIGLAAEIDGGLAGYLFGEIRAFEFGSEPCGWIFAVGIDPVRARRQVGSLLVAEALARFQATGVSRVRTMVRRNNVPVLAFFRTNGFAGGPYVQLEVELDEA